jgi:hypothetical protein
MQAHNFMQYIFTTLALYNSLYHTLRSFATPQQTWMSTKRGLTLLHSFRHSDVISNRLGCRRHNVIHLLTTLALYYSLYYTLRSSATPQQTWMPTTRGPSSIVHLPLTLALPPRWCVCVFVFVCVCVFVCMCVFVYTHNISLLTLALAPRWYTHTHTHSLTHAHTLSLSHTHTYIYMCVSLYLHIYLFIYLSFSQKLTATP